MIIKLKALDLFCGAGGASMGLHLAGFDVVGVDKKPQPNYPFDFSMRDALALMSEWDWHHGYDFIWASPPCQAYTHMLNHGITDRSKHPDHLEEVRRRLQESGKPYIIENVQGAPLLNSIMLCGEMFGLRVTRHRFFESSLCLLAPAHPAHRGKGHRKQGDGGYYFRVYGHETGKREWGAAMGIDWMRSPELTQAIPPSYSEYLGRQVMQACFEKAA